jgi:hypothetical protein
MQIIESHIYRISTKYVEEFMGCIKKSIYNRMETKLYYESVEQKFVFSA